MSGAPSIELDEIMATKAGSVDPVRFPDEVFDLYSIPAFDSREPEVAAGNINYCHIGIKQNFFIPYLDDQLF